MSSIFMNIDVTVFAGFLLTNLVLGIMASRGVNTIRRFAVGDKDFSTATIALTIISIWVSGEFFFTIVAESYKDGLLFMSILIADFLSYFFIGYFLADYLEEFLDKISIAEVMGSLYGRKVRTITAISGVTQMVGVIAIQLQIAGLLFEYVFNANTFYGIIVAGVIITLYSSFGGIKAVTFTDIMQFCTFGMVIPIVAYLLLRNVDNPDAIFTTIAQNPKFSFSESFSFSNPQIYYYISLFLWLLIPNFGPSIFQRVAMAKDTKQVRNSFIIAAFAGLLLAAFVCWIGVLVLYNHPNIPEGDILRYTIANYSWIVGLKGVIAAGIMAMIMSTVDSCINSNSILLVHDLNKSLNIDLGKNELNYTRFCSLSIGAVSILLALRGGNFFELILWTSTCYMPIVTVPFIMSVCGFRSSGRSVLAGMGAGFIVVLFWELLLKEQMAGVGGLLPGMLANLITLFAYHYFFKQEGGWVCVKKSDPVSSLPEQKKSLFEITWNNIKNFDLLAGFRNNMPKDDNVTVSFGLFIMVSTFFSISALPKTSHETFTLLLYMAILLTSTLITGYPLYARKWHEKASIAIGWNMIIVVVLVCFSFLIVLLSDFAEMQLMAFMVNIIAMTTLINWRYSLFYLMSGLSAAVFIYERFLHQEADRISSLEYKIIYLSLLVASALMAFIKPRQERQDLAENQIEILEEEVQDLGSKVITLKQKASEYQQQIQGLNETVVHYVDRIAGQEKEIERLGAAAQKILNNVNHELRIPVGNVMNFSQMLQGRAYGAIHQSSWRNCRMRYIKIRTVFHQ